VRKFIGVALLVVESKKFKIERPQFVYQFSRIVSGLLADACDNAYVEILGRKTRSSG
jgi:hypothetical protein